MVTHQSVQRRNDSKTTVSIRLMPEEWAALQAIADKIGNGATPTGVMLQAVRDRIKVGE